MKKNPVVILVCLAVVAGAIFFYFYQRDGKDAGFPSGTTVSAGSDVSASTGTGTVQVPGKNGDDQAQAGKVQASSDNKNPVIVNTQGNNLISGPLSEKDFTVSDGKESINLDAAFKGFQTTRQETVLDDNYFGDVVKDNITYTYYIHRYKDFNLFVSNVNYDLKQRDSKEQYISQILLRGNNYKTSRGISTGADIMDIIAAYGEGKRTFIDDKPALSYQYKDMEMVFTLNGATVEGIMLRILAGVK